MNGISDKKKWSRNKRKEGEVRGKEVAKTEAGIHNNSTPPKARTTQMPVQHAFSSRREERTSQEEQKNQHIDCSKKTVQIAPWVMLKRRIEQRGNRTRNKEAASRHACQHSTKQ